MYFLGLLLFLISSNLAAFSNELPQVLNELSDEDRLQLELELFAGICDDPPSKDAENFCQDSADSLESRIQMLVNGINESAQCFDRENTVGIEFLNSASEVLEYELGCPDGQNTLVLSKKCASEFACAAVRNALVVQNPGKAVADLFVHAVSEESKKQSQSTACLGGNGGTSCIQEFVNGIFLSIKSLVWDLPEMVIGDRVRSMWGRIRGDIDDPSTDNALELGQMDASLWSMFKENPKDFTYNLSVGLYESIVEGIKNSFGCEKWSGAPYVSECLKPMAAWDCASCAQRYHAVCGVIGFITGEVFPVSTGFGAALGFFKHAALGSVKISKKIANFSQASKGLEKLNELSSRLKLDEIRASVVSSARSGGASVRSGFRRFGSVDLPNSLVNKMSEQAIVGLKKMGEYSSRTATRVSAFRGVPQALQAGSTLLNIGGKTLRVSMSPAVLLFKLSDRSFRVGYDLTDNFFGQMSVISKKPPPIFIPGK